MTVSAHAFRSRPSAGLETELEGFESRTLEAVLAFQREPSRESLRAVLPGFINYHLPLGKEPLEGAPGDEMEVARDLGLDSLSLSEMAFKMEDLFGFRVETRDMAGLRTVGDLLDYLLLKLELP